MELLGFAHIAFLQAMKYLSHLNFAAIRAIIGEDCLFLRVKIKSIALQLLTYLLVT